jgi:hypothetical protein
MGACAPIAVFAGHLAFHRSGALILQAIYSQCVYMRIKQA